MALKCYLQTWTAGFVLISIVCNEAMPRASADEIQGRLSRISPEEFMDRVLQGAESVSKRTLSGRYILRTINKKKTEKEVNDALDRLFLKIKSGERYFSQNPTERDHYVKETRKGLAERLNRWRLTSLVSPITSGDRFRQEDVWLPDDMPLEQLAKIVRRPDWTISGVDKRPTITVWNGEVAKRLNPLFPPKNPGRFTFIPDARLDMLTEMPAKPRFANWGREITDKNFLRLAREKKLPVVVFETSTREGEPALDLRVGVSGALSATINVRALPGKGYLIADYESKLAGVTFLHEVSRDFYRTTTGIWVPLYNKAEVYTLTPQGTPELAVESECLAVDKPQFDIEVNPELFDLKPGSKTMVVSISPVTGSPGVVFGNTKAGSAENKKNNRIKLFALLGATVSLGTIFIWRIRRTMPPNTAKKRASQR